MNQPRVERKREVDEDLFHIAIHIASDNPEAGYRFYEAAEITFANLAKMPEMGPQRKFRHPKLQNLRSWQVKGFPNYIIFYRALIDGVELIRVLHGARDLERRLINLD